MMHPGGYERGRGLCRASRVGLEQDNKCGWRRQRSVVSATGARTAGNVLSMACRRCVVRGRAGTSYRSGVKHLHKCCRGDRLEGKRVGRQDGNDAPKDRT